MARNKNCGSEFNGDYTSPWLNFSPVNFRDKKSRIRERIANKLNQTVQMFEYEHENPDFFKWIPSYLFEQIPQSAGRCIITDKYADHPIMLTGGQGGEPDIYYRGKIFTTANPALNIDDSFTIGEDCILFRNDSLCQGLLPLHRMYATLEVENELSLYIALVKARNMSIISASTDRDKLSADKYYTSLEDGNLTAILENAFLKGINVQPEMSGAVNAIGQLIESAQYIHARWANACGMNANYNMKRESLTDAEVGMNSDLLFPTVDDMEKRRKEMIEDFNEMYGVKYGRFKGVRFSSAWERRQISADNETGTEETNVSTETKEGVENAD